MELTWYGHSTWHVAVDGTDLLIDPFFENPKTDTDPEEVDADYVLLTHGHADHIGDADRFSGATLVAVPELVSYAEDNFGYEDAVGGMGMNLGGTVECGDAWVTMVRADHTNGIETDYGASAGMPAGFVISDKKPTQESDPDTTTFYHAGDTSLMVEMREVIAPFLEPDFAALPAGDHFTMGPAQAAIAADWLDVDYACPMHYDTFPPIEIDTEDFERELKATGAGAEAVILDGDESYTL
ncbi:metal-dependent hydrolase [Natronomonas gomsonensis]|jgi:L-ascorbate metabolism protein UlaG (beta-lactamase superfamily)|uniref:metal-dependent hydrolase n=1 Tax=Natronomonas gomsonensis TaxID=1046043 RepID=UPI0020CA67E5|nr:metal-dependent hydrolase [Natronomonas gomsonensis]MCY4729135.1 metal-dependent hydrolase [Natronomonas gomsonensis]